MTQDPKPTKDVDGCCCVDTFAVCGDVVLDSNTTNFAYSDCKKPEDKKCADDNMVVKLKDTKTPGCCCTITPNKETTQTTRESTTSEGTKTPAKTADTAGANLVSVWTSGCVLLAFLV